MKMKIFASDAIESCYLAGLISKKHDLDNKERAIVIQYARDNDVALDWTR